jgi:serine/threonine-protein kinase PRP4
MSSRNSSHKRGYSPRRHYEDDYRESRDHYSRDSRRSSSPSRKRSRHEKNDSSNARHSKYSSSKDSDLKSKVVVKEKKVQIMIDPQEEEERKEQERLRMEEDEYKRKIEEQLNSIDTNEEEEIRKARERRQKRQQMTQNVESLKPPIKEEKIVQKDDKIVQKDDKIPPISPSSDEEEQKAPVADQERQHFLEQLEKERNKRDEEHNHTPKELQPSMQDDDDEFDMFSGKEIAAPNTVMHGPRLTAHQLAQTDNPNLSANWNDEEGYYCFRTGEMLQDRYHVLGFHGKGVFGTVLKAIDTITQQDVAIKVIRNNEWMKKSGIREIDLLMKLNKNDPDDKCHCVRALTHFQFRNHLCIVFEGLAMDLRSVIKKYGKEQGKQVGINLDGVRLYALQLFVALKHLRNNNILHADIKPDNILVNEKSTIVKLCDFGSGSDASENAITPYLVSRFYRAPEIVLGMRYSFPIDIWSVGCSLYELFTGEILFPSANNNDLLYQVQQVKGPFTNKMLKKCLFRDKHFDQSGVFLYKEDDSVTNKPMIKRIAGVAKTRDLKTLLLAADETGNNRKKILQLADLLEKCLALDPVKRITVDEALEHPFLSSK